MSAQPIRPIQPQPTTQDTPDLEAQIQRLLQLYRQQNQEAYGRFVEDLIRGHYPQLLNVLRGTIFGSTIEAFELDQPSPYDED